MPTERIHPKRLSYTVHEAAAMLGVSRNVIFDLFAIGELRRVRAGKRVPIPAADLDGFLERGGVSELSTKCRPKPAPIHAEVEVVA
jgi:excisionase family DNA binding protein